MRVFSKVDFSTNCKKNNLDTSIPEYYSIY